MSTDYDFIPNDDVVITGGSSGSAPKRKKSNPKNVKIPATKEREVAVRICFYSLHV